MSPVVEESIEIAATAEEVWKVFTDPLRPRSMGGTYDSEWRPGDSLRWRRPGSEGLTDSLLLEIVPQRVLRHTLAKPQQMPEEGQCDPKPRAGEKALQEIVSEITYGIREMEGRTILVSREEFIEAPTEKDFLEIRSTWKAALKAVRDIAEQR
jgi:hypothetical protein